MARKATISVPHSSAGTSVLIPDLTRTDAELRAKFFELLTFDDVANVLEVPSHQLAYILYKTPKSKRFTSFNIKKRRGGVRKIDAPCRSWKILQSKMTRILTLVYRSRGCVHGFVKSPPLRTIVTNARSHCRSRFVLNLDLEDFFPSIHFGRIYGMLVARPYCLGINAARHIAHLSCCESRLAQGSPVSPIISNMICARLDGEISRLSRKFHCAYTRYCDDITISTSRRTFPRQIAEHVKGTSITELGESLSNVIEHNGFLANERKTRLQFRTQRQEVTGLVVNRKPNVRRKYKAQIRAMLHAWEKYGYEAAQQDFLIQYDNKHRGAYSSDRLFSRVIGGRINFIGEVCGRHTRSYRMFRRKYDILLGKSSCKLVAERAADMSLDYDVFICHASEDKANIVRPIAKSFADAGIKCWLDENEIKWGDDIMKKINYGLGHSQFVMIVISKYFLAKNWPEREMNSALAIEFDEGITRVIALLVDSGSTIGEILSKYPLLRSKRCEQWRGETGSIVALMKDRLES